MLSSFVSICAQLILIKSRALLPRPRTDDAGGGEEVGDPEEELRARLLLYRRYRDAGQRLAQRLELGGLFRREPAVAVAAGYAGARAPAGPPLDIELLSGALAGMLRIVVPVPPRPETLARTVTMEERADAIRQALRGAPALVLQELLRDVRDRVVWAVTFMAMLELVKGRELTVEQAEPWGPISIRRRVAATEDGGR
jgi:segregation and condensation protein A